MDRLVAAFNPAAVDGLMCRYTLSVGWDGRLYDCDFNQMIDLGTAAEAPQTIFDATPRSARRSPHHRSAATASAAPPAPDRAAAAPSPEIPGGSEDPPLRSGAISGISVARVFVAVAA